MGHTCDAAMNSMPVLFCIVRHAASANDFHLLRSLSRTVERVGWMGRGAGMKVTAGPPVGDMGIGGNVVLSGVPDS